MTFCKFTDCRDDIFNKRFAISDFRGKYNRHFRIECIRHAIDGIECQPLSAFNLGNSCATDPYPSSDLSLSDTQLGPSLSEKFSNIVEFICHFVIFRKDTKCFLYMKHMIPK